VREDGRIVGGEWWQEKVHNREEWKKLLRTARNRHIMHMPMEWMNVTVFHSTLKVYSPLPPKPLVCYPLQPFATVISCTSTIHYINTH